MHYIILDYLILVQKKNFKGFILRKIDYSLFLGTSDDEPYRYWFIYLIQQNFNSILPFSLNRIGFFSHFNPQLDFTLTFTFWYSHFVAVNISLHFWLRQSKDAKTVTYKIPLALKRRLELNYLGKGGFRGACPPDI